MRRSGLHSSAGAEKPFRASAGFEETEYKMKIEAMRAALTEGGNQVGKFLQRSRRFAKIKRAARSRMTLYVFSAARPEIGRHGQDRETTLKLFAASFSVAG